MFIKKVRLFFLSQSVTLSFFYRVKLLIKTTQKPESFYVESPVPLLAIIHQIKSCYLSNYFIGIVKDAEEK